MGERVSKEEEYGSVDEHLVEWGKQGGLNKWEVLVLG
jgi:hypothetical protein